MKNSKSGSTGVAEIPAFATALERLETSLAGQLVRPSDSSYDQARQVWNGAVNRYPALIVRCQTSRDVLLAVNFASDHSLPVSVRGGGHNTPGLAVRDDALMIDLSAMKGLEVDPVRRVARAEPGLTIGEFIRGLQPYGLMTTTGSFEGSVE
ncbi:MAG: FAD-dependent oxidoreductase, partial [Anaerolineae bacterium]|nr:FAD-dependent oxidoreductase [Anaerolineae bacterium]